MFFGYKSLVNESEGSAFIPTHMHTNSMSRFYGKSVFSESVIWITNIMVFSHLGHFMVRFVFLEKQK